MYHIMVNAAEDAIRLLGEDAAAAALLIRAQQRCEAMYIDAPEPGDSAESESQ